MPTSPTEEPVAEALLIVLDEQAEAGSWLTVAEGRVAARGAEPDWPAAAQTIISVPGSQVTIHWLELAETLSPAQAAAAARLMLADASAEPIETLHVAVGAAEDGRTPVALVPAALMVRWIDAAATRGIDPDVLVPSPMLLAAPDTGFALRDLGGTADYRARGAAFRLEPDLAPALTAGQTIEPVDEADYEAALPPLLAAAPLNLRQGTFARRRRLRIVEGSWRRLAAYGALLVALTLLIQVATILSYTFAADRLEAEAATLRQPGAPAVRGGFGPVATLLFEAIRSTPNAELTAMDYRADGSIRGSLRVDNPATLAAFRGRAEASGLRFEGGGAPAAGVAEFQVHR
ncbi:MAG: type II secretion system protein GspL [Sphingomonas sp.]